jgi:Tfp pilus assembly PilM family ATPase
VREAVIHSVLKLLNHFFSFAALVARSFAAFLRLLFSGGQQSRSKVGIDITDKSICLVELSWQRFSPFRCWVSLHLLYKGLCACRNRLNRLCLKLTGHYMDPLMLIPQPKAPASGFWQIASLLHIPVGQGVVLNGEVAQSDKLANAMAAVVREAKGAVKEVALSVDAHLVFQIPLRPVAHYFGARWELNFDSLPKNPNTLVLQDAQAIQLTQQLISQQDIELPLPIHQVFLMYVVDAGNGANEGGEVKAEPKNYDPDSAALVLVGCPRKEVSSREQLLANVRLQLHVLEPRTNAALRAIGLIDPTLRPRLLGQVWVWISLENSVATVQLVDGMQRLEGQADLNTDALQTYLNYCIGWAGSALRDIFVSWTGTPMLAPLEEGAVNKQFEQAETNRALRAIEEIAVQLDICVHRINPLRPSGGFSEYSGFVRDVAKKFTESELSGPRTGAPLAGESAVAFDANSVANSMQPDWLVALGLAWGLIDNPRQLDLANMCTDIAPKSLSTENAGV